jgi:hypothetical protein
MAFGTAPGYGNLPNGAFSPVIYSKKAQIAFRKASVVQAITNTDYMGEISGAGDTVKIIQEPQISVSDYARGVQISAQDLTDSELTLTVDQAKYFAFKVDDIEQKHSHINWESLASNNAGYKLKDAFDTNVLSHIDGQVPAAQALGTSAAIQGIGFVNTTVQMSPLKVLARLGRYLDVLNVPTDGRWLVADPIFWEIAADENNKLLDASVMGENGTNARLSNGMIANKPIRGFKCYVSNNLPVGGTGPTATTSATNYGTILAGHMSSTATVEQISKTESYRDPDSFADVVRGLHVFGRKVLRTDAVVKCVWNSRTA